MQHVKVFATGAHDGVLAFPGNDLPGVFSARALCMLLARGVEPDGPVVVAGSGPWADELAQRLGERATRIDVAALVGVEGTAGVKRVIVREGDEERTMKSEVLAVAVPGAPSFELAAQAGAEVRFDPERGYAVVVDEHGRAAEGVCAVGECTGEDFDPDALTLAATRCRGRDQPSMSMSKRPSPPAVKTTPKTPISCEVVDELVRRRAAEELARARDRREQGRREQRKEHAREHEIPRPRAHRHRAEERARGGDARRRDEADQEEPPAPFPRDRPRRAARSRGSRSTSTIATKIADGERLAREDRARATRAARAAPRARRPRARAATSGPTASTDANATATQITPGATPWVASCPA